MKFDTNSNSLVAFSRAGDVFHYRWAARRCLRLIQPTSNLEFVIIEGSEERKKAGEYTIDVSEYYDSSTSKKRIEYFQLKHTTVQLDKPFNLSGLKQTIAGFSKRYQQHLDEKSLDGISFTIITNRKIDESFKQNIKTIVKGGTVNKRFRQTLKEYTKLDDKEIIRFCGLLNFEDSEGDYKVQKEDLRIEMSRLQPGSIDPAQIDSIVALVQEKVLPGSNRKIVKEDILRPFGVTSEQQLFPAPPLFESTDNITKREQYQSLLDTIASSDHPLIIHAEGGVGKTVFCQYVIQALPEGSLGIAYDCFGSGKYRSRSKPRHRHRDALVQIANELASVGLCERMLVHNTTQESDIMRDFLSRIESSIRSLKKGESSARLFILIDAADNAEMAAQEIGDSCFANELLREEFPQGCKVILLCRSERIHLLKPPSSIPQLNLLPFSKEETFENLKKWFPKVNESEALEFHRLTTGNPRVQMNSILIGHSSVNELLASLGPSGTTVEEQIEQQIAIAIQNIKDALPEVYQTSVSKICTGLASLPPNIPIKVLSHASEVKIEDVKSFIADIGRSLWMPGESVLFRDEPTETWFRKTYLGSKDDFSSYIKTLMPLAGYFTYVAEVLPQLYLQAGEYDQLINIALSDELLPLNNPIDTRNVLIYRLQFAFKAALREKKYEDAVKLALRAGEEVAGDQRQQSLFQKNIDLLPKLQDKLKVQEIAFKGLLKSGWEGSENVYSASLLSEIEEFQGEASGYLRSASNWLHIYFEESRQRKKQDQSNGVGFDDILEMALIHLNLKGPRSCLKFLNRIKPKESIFQVMKQLVSRLIDAGRFSEIDEILKNAKGNKFHVVAIVSELVEVGRFAQTDDVERCLGLLSQPNTRIKKPQDPYHDNITPSIVSFLEVCLYRKINTKAILEVLDYYVPNEASRGIGSWSDPRERITFLKAFSIRKAISKDAVVNIEELLPAVYKSENNKRGNANEIRELKEVIGGLIPWYVLKIQVISGNDIDLVKGAEQANQDSKKAYESRYKSYDILPHEIADILSSILVYCNQQESKDVQQYYDTYMRDALSFSIDHRIRLVRAGNRVAHLNQILAELENSTYELIKGQKGVGPEEIAKHYIMLARAVLSSSKDDAAVYFEEAINIVSKFGDEIVERWQAIEALGELSAPNSSDELAYRFIRCAELVGEHVYREKHWDRSGALVTCTRMSPQVGISALSRWRDREIGRFEDQLEALLSELVKSKLIDPTVGWSLTRFFSNHQLNDFLSICLSNEASKKLKSQIFNDAFTLLSKEGTSHDYWAQLKSISDEFQILHEDLNRVVDFYKGDVKSENTASHGNHKRNQNEAELKKWDNIFNGVEILKPHGLAILVERFLSEFNKTDRHHYWHIIDLYNEILNRIKANEIHDFIDLLLSSDKVGQYECLQVLSAIPDAWKNKVSFKKKWPEIINRFGRRYAHGLVNEYSFGTAVRELGLDGKLIIDLKSGIFHGLSQGQEFVDASIFFGFIKHASTFIDAKRATELADYALSRFELHVEDDFADGLWGEWLHVTKDLNKTIAGLIWSALGSPRSRTRWNACHAIKKLADFGCKLVLGSLVDWMEDDKVDAFGSAQFPFYNLHARQYLLIAFSRISVDYPELLVEYKKVFLKYSHFKPHILIQKFSSDIALRIEKAIPGTYSSAELSPLIEIGRSKQKRRNAKHEYRTDSYLHTKGEVDTELDYHFGWDIDHYWYRPLGDVFAVPEKQIQDLCANVIINEWGLKRESGYNKDPRVNLWNGVRARETWHDHSEYPKTDNWDFYLSYHSMLVTAARLIKNMPVIIFSDSWDNEDPWDSWLSRHLLARRDGKWLADCRGPLPLERPEWISNGISEYWSTEIQDQDFLNSVIIKGNKENWLNIKGGWTERHDSRYETYSVSTALVSKETSDALLRALSTCSNPHDYKLPDYEESNMEIDSGRFQLKGLVHNPDGSNGIDEFDPYGDNLSYPPFSMGEPYLKYFNLSSDTEGKAWSFSNGEAALKCDTWSGNTIGYDEEPHQTGKRLSASLSLLKKLCKVYNCHLIIEVIIRRDIEYKHRPGNYEYLYPSHKIYILLEDGKLITTEKNH